MKIQTQPDVQCPRHCGLMEGRGVCGAMDLYHCPACGKLEWLRHQQRCGSARKKATDDPYEVAACSGIIINDTVLPVCPGCSEGGYFADDKEIFFCQDYKYDE